MSSLSTIDKNKFFNELNKVGYVTISNLMSSTSLDYVNKVLHENLDVEELQRKKAINKFSGIAYREYWKTIGLKKDRRTKNFWFSYLISIILENLINPLK